MSLLSAIILPKLKQEILSLEPDMAEFILKQIKSVAGDVIEWVEKKVHVDLNCDGKIGEDEKD